MAFPVQQVRYPSTLNGVTNGRIPTAMLDSTPGQAGGSTVRLVTPASRAWRALAAAAKSAGHILKATSSADSYRSYDQQVATFTSRYSIDPIIGQPQRRWDGHTWWLIPGKAPAAVPGTSNHGWGLAVDVGEERDGDTGTESMDQATLDWLVAHEERYGFSHELQVEPWHIRYWSGDLVPPAVIDFEQGEDMGVWDDPNSKQNHFLDELIKTTRAALVWGQETFDGSPYLGNPQATYLVRKLNEIADSSTSVELSDEQLDMLADKVAARLRALTFVAEDTA